MQLPFLPVGKVDGKRAWWQIWTPIAGVLNNALFIVAAVVGARSGVLGGAAKACGNNVLIPVGIMGVVLHTQMGYDKRARWSVSVLVRRDLDPPPTACLALSLVLLPFQL